MLTATTRKRSAFPVPALPLLVETMHKDEHIYEWGKSLIGLDVTMGDIGKATGVQVISHDQITGEDFVGECKLEDVKLKIGGTNDWRSVYAGVARDSIQTVVDPNVQDRTEAEEVAEAILREKSFDFIKGYGKAEGDAGLRAGAVVTIKCAGIRYDGEYIAEEVEHKLSMKGGYTTEFDIRRNMIGDEAVKELGGSRAVGPSHAPPPREKPESEQITVYEEDEGETEPLLKEILSVACYDKDGNETTKCFEGQPLTIEAAVNASVEEGVAVNFDIYYEGDGPERNRLVETLTGIVRKGRAVLQWVNQQNSGLVEAMKARPKIFIRASSEGCEEVQSECVEIEPAKVELLTTREVAALRMGGTIREMIDLDSGKRFNIFWGAWAETHTDWNPATPADTAIVKSIINPSGNTVDWTNPSSWPYFVARPAVLNLDGRLIAVGIHLYPHDIIMGGRPGPPLSSQEGRRITADEAQAFGLSTAWVRRWYIGGHMCMYYRDSTGGGTPEYTDSMNKAAEEAYSRGL